MWHNMEILIIMIAVREERRREDEGKLRAFWAVWLDSLWKCTLSCEEQTGALKLKESEGESEQKFSSYNKESISFLVSWQGIFLVIFWCTPPGSCSAKAWWSIVLYGKRPLTTVRMVQNSINNYFVFARPSVWLFWAVQHCSCSGKFAPSR